MSPDGNAHVRLWSYNFSMLCSIQGVSLSILCGDVTWLTEEMLFRNRDVGFGGSIADVVRYSLSLLAPYIIVLMPSRSFVVFVFVFFIKF